MRRGLLEGRRGRVAGIHDIEYTANRDIMLHNGKPIRGEDLSQGLEEVTGIQTIAILRYLKL